MWPESRPAATHGVAWATGGRAEGGWYPAARGRAERGHHAPRGWPHATGETARQLEMFESLNALGSEMAAIPAAIILEDGLPLETA